MCFILINITGLQTLRQKKLKTVTWYWDEVNHVLNVPGPCSLWMQKQVGTESEQRNGNRNGTCALLQIVPAAGCNAVIDVLVTEYSSCLEPIH